MEKVWYSNPCQYPPVWWNGRHRRLKISRQQCRTGSSPVTGTTGTTQYRGVEQLVARRAHNPEVGGSSPPSATIEKVPIFEPGNSGFKNGNFSFILGSRKELRFVLNRSFHVQLSMRSVTVVKFDILF